MLIHLLESASIRLGKKTFRFTVRFGGKISGGGKVNLGGKVRKYNSQITVIISFLLCEGITSFCDSLTFILVLLDWYWITLGGKKYRYSVAAGGSK